MISPAINPPRDNTPIMPLRVVELFAGVGGFRIGIERVNAKQKKKLFEIVWGNQWEPTTNLQHAYDVYKSRWPNSSHSNEDITKVEISDIPGFDVIVAGFPCQDYSVAKPKRRSKGIKGKKGALWWRIEEILRKTRENNPSLAKYAVFENVDRLLKSPAHQPGRDFALMITSLVNLGYDVEWRIINAADYGFPQKRRRVFIFASSSCQPKEKPTLEKLGALLRTDGVLARAFPIARTVSDIHRFKSSPSYAKVLSDFRKKTKLPYYMNAGVVVNGEVLTARVRSMHRGRRYSLKDVLSADPISDEFLIKPEEVWKWRYAKGRKKILKKNRVGIRYWYKEGAIPFPDPLDKPARTVVTLEGSKRASRMTHVIEYKKGKYRRLTPEELETLNGFPQGHTKSPGITARRRAFLMGNALVTGLVTAIFTRLAQKNAGTALRSGTGVPLPRVSLKAQSEVIQMPRYGREQMARAAGGR